MSTRVAVGTIGFEWRRALQDIDGEPLDLTDIDTIVYRFRRGDGVAIDRTGEVYLDDGYAATDGIVSYTSVSGDISVPGEWFLELHLTFNSGAFFVYPDSEPFKAFSPIPDP